MVPVLGDVALAPLDLSRRLMGPSSDSEWLEGIGGEPGRRRFPLARVRPNPEQQGNPQVRYQGKFNIYRLHAVDINRHGHLRLGRRLVSPVADFARIEFSRPPSLAAPGAAPASPSFRRDSPPGGSDSAWLESDREDRRRTRSEALSLACVRPNPEQQGNQRKDININAVTFRHFLI